MIQHYIIIASFLSICKNNKFRKKISKTYWHFTLFVVLYIQVKRYNLTNNTKGGNNNGQGQKTQTQNVEIKHASGNRHCYHGNNSVVKSHFWLCDSASEFGLNNARQWGRRPPLAYKAHYKAYYEKSKYNIYTCIHCLFINHTKWNSIVSIYFKLS